MSDALSFAEIANQHVELLPARTVLSTYYCEYHDYYYYQHCCDYGSVDQNAEAEANQYIINIGSGDVLAANEAAATNVA